MTSLPLPADPTDTPTTRHAAWRWLTIVLGAAALGAFGVYCATHSVDFPVYHRVARQILRGDFELYPAAVYKGGSIPSHDFRYAPATAFLFVPFGLLPLQVSAFVFFALKVVAIAYIGSVVRRWVGAAAPSTWLTLVALLAVGGYVLEELHYGNFHFLCVALMLFAFDSAESGRVVRPAIALGIAVATKLTPVLLVVYFGWRRRYRLALAALAVVGLLAFLPAAVVGFRTNLHLLQGFGKYALEKIDESDNYALRGALVRMGLSLGAATRIWFMAVAVGAAATIAVLRRPPLAPITRFLEVCVVLTATLVASPHAQRRYFVVLYVPILALLALAKARRPFADPRLVYSAVALTGAIGTLAPALFAGKRLSLLYQAYSPHVLGALAIFFVLVVVSVRAEPGRSSVA